MNSALPRWIAVSAGLLGFAGVGLGALGAHGAVHDSLVAAGTREVWQTAVVYQFVHTIALFALSGSATFRGKERWIAGCWIAGVILFSGSLYWLALGGPKGLGPFTPAGGLAFMSGWVLVAWRALSSSKP